MELIRRNDGNEDSLRIDKDLSELGMYVRDPVQSSFDYHWLFVKREWN